MADDETVAAAGEASIRDEGHVLAQAPAHDRARRCQHFAHARAADWPLVADDDHVPRLDPPVEDGPERGLLGFEHDGFAREARSLLAGDLGHGAPRREVAVEDPQVAVGLDRIR